jgi:hypothetical protein
MLRSSWSTWPQETTSRVSRSITTTIVDGIEGSRLEAHGSQMLSEICIYKFRTTSDSMMCEMASNPRSDKHLEGGAIQAAVTR